MHCQPRKNKGRIINISSEHGRILDTYKSSYCAAKFGQIGFTKVIAKLIIQPRDG
nr:SDR family NAD(P)-dependent oxidoreductase [Bacillus sp. ISL-34]